MEQIEKNQMEKNKKQKAIKADNINELQPPMYKPIFTLPESTAAPVYHTSFE